MMNADLSIHTQTRDSILDQSDNSMNSAGMAIAIPCCFYITAYIRYEQQITMEFI